MPINANSRIRKTRKALHGWKDGDRFYLSIGTKDEKLARNEYASSREALQEASKRHLPIIWDDPKAIE